MFPGAAGNGPAPKVAANPDGEFQHGRNHDHAFRLVQQVLGNVVGNIEDRLEHFAAGFQALLFTRLIGRERRYSQQENSNECGNTSHVAPPWQFSRIADQASMQDRSRVASNDTRTCEARLAVPVTRTSSLAAALPPDS